MVAGFIPAIAFVTLTLFAFDPILPQAIHRRLGDIFNPLSQSGLVMLIFSIVLGFTLTVLNNFLLKIFEGYIFLDHFPFLKKAELNRERKLRQKIIIINRKLDEYRNADKMEHPRAKRLLQHLSTLQVQHSQAFPGLKSEIMPTPFGNFLKASEYYPMDRYHIDSVPLWPRLMHAIDPIYNLKIQETRNQLSFVVNCSFLALSFGVLSFVAAGYQWLLGELYKQGQAELTYFIPINLTQKVYDQRTLIYLFLGGLAVFLSIVFYRASLVSVAEFGDMIRSAYDLFRFDLLQKLHLDLPANSKMERNQWSTICDVITKGFVWEEAETLTYKHPPESPHNPSPEASPESAVH